MAWLKLGGTVELLSEKYLGKLLGLRAKLKSMPYIRHIRLSVQQFVFGKGDFMHCLSDKGYKEMNTPGYIGQL